jgi:hypothetical protein
MSRVDAIFPRHDVGRPHKIRFDLFEVFSIELIEVRGANRFSGRAEIN